MAPINVAHNSNSSNVRHQHHNPPSIPLTLAQYEQSLHSASQELKYERSSHLVDIITKDENLRRMRFDMHLLQDNNEELRDLLTQEEDRTESLEKLVNDNLTRAEQAEAHLSELQQDIQIAEQELSVLRVCKPHFLVANLR